MITLRDIQKWIYEFQEKNFEPPKTIPLTKVELLDLTEEANCSFQVVYTIPKPQVFGLDVEVSPFAETLRHNRLEIPLSQFLTEYSIEDSLRNNMKATQREAMYQCFRGLKATILSDKTRLSVEYEWDCFSWIKKLLHITKWFPIKKKSSIIDCTVLYPYCKVQFPHNKQTLKFKFS